MPRVPPQILRERERWRRAPRRRPAQVGEPGPGQESVWNYPRPPRVEDEARLLRVEWAGAVLAESRRALRVCETASPPCYYVPFDDVRTDLLEPTASSSLCEWKGVARYFRVRVDGRVAEDVAWSYPDPFEGFERLRDHLAFFASRVDACFLGDERVVPQPGGFYGGWITRDVVGPFKGEPGSEGW